MPGKLTEEDAAALKKVNYDLKITQMSGSIGAMDKAIAAAEKLMKELAERKDLET